VCSRRRARGWPGRAQWPSTGLDTSPLCGAGEGIGPRGLPFSFSLARVRGRITIRQPDDILIRGRRGAPFKPQWDGQLLGPRKATLSTPAPTNEPKCCGWPTRRLTWRLAPAKRVPVKPGVWTAAVTVPEKVRAS
jgi:hypothetical protein